MNFGQPGLEAVPIRWYFVSDDTPHLGIETPFASRNWQGVKNHERPPLGEVLGADRPWVDGRPPLARPTAGVPCGTPAQWLGQEPIPIVPLSFGFPLCCAPVVPPISLVDAGLVIAGEAAEVAPPVLSVDAGLVMAGLAAEVIYVDAGLVMAGAVVRLEYVDAGLVMAGVAVENPFVGIGLVMAGLAGEVVYVDGGMCLAGEAGEVT